MEKGTSEEQIRLMVHALHDEFGWFNKEELENTPHRIYKFYKEWAGRGQFKFTMFDSKDTDQLVILQNIEFQSMCAHHMLPFYGMAHVGYLPSGQICGISKLARTVQHFASRPQTQETMSNQVADFLYAKTNSTFVMVVCKAVHLCMRCRGVRQQKAHMTSSALRHQNLEDANWMSLKQEFLTLISSSIQGGE